MSPRLRRLMAELLDAMRAEARPAATPPSPPVNRGTWPDHDYFIRADYTPCCERHAERGFRPDPRATEALSGPSAPYVADRMGWRR